MQETKLHINIDTTPKKYIRQNIVTLRKENPREFGRFIMALKNLEDSDEWSRICGIHGNTFKPNDPEVLCPTDPTIVSQLAKTGEPFYCAHSVEPFITWHVPYLHEFEKLLNIFNYSKNQSYLALPYFDICEQNVDYSFMNCAEITVLFDDDEKITVRNPLASATYWPKGVKTPIQRNGFLKAETEQQKKQINTIRRQLYNTLHAKTYEEFSSQVVSSEKTYKPYGYVPLETPHNAIHDIIGGEGGNMSDISISAFDPIFWLHHCNMDRFFYNWLKYVHEHSSYNDIFSTNSWNATLAPFTNSYNTFGWQNDTANFLKLKTVIMSVGDYEYGYDAILLHDEETEHAYIEILDIPIPDESMTIYAYLFPKHEVLTEKNKEKWYAGSVSWFGINRIGTYCERCNRVRTNLKIDILDFYKQHVSTIKKYYIWIEGHGKLIKTADGSYKIYGMGQILKDGDIYITV
uniref:Tyrosinase copper-binding domain-containing protein n=1 Tax=viral metagenome TaxID=1070528 RepID=A0A6C0HZK6_9ZZZZ